MYDSFYDRGPFGFIGYRENGTITIANETAASLLKYSRDQLIGTDIEKILTLSSRIFYQTHFFPLIKIQGHVEEIFMGLLAADGQHLPVLVNASIVQEDKEGMICCAFIVVNNRKKFEDELIAARKTAEDALNENTALIQIKSSLQQQTHHLNEQVRQVNQQNQELQQFHHVITHSLKEPLRKVLMYSSILEEGNNSAALNRMIHAAHQLNAVVSSLQQYVWLTGKETDFVDVDLNIVAAQAIDKINQENGALLDVKQVPLHTVQGDPEQLQILFYHLLQNAVKFRKRDPATVTISSVELKQNVLRDVAGKYQYEDYVRLEFTDDGIGFDAEWKEYIFEIFRKLDKSEGQGLGLALCRKIVENHHGRIEADSKKDIYTTIRVWLPVSHGNK